MSVRRASSKAPWRRSPRSRRDGAMSQHLSIEPCRVVLLFSASSRSIPLLEPVLGLRYALSLGAPAAP